MAGIGNDGFREIYPGNGGTMGIPPHTIFFHKNMGPCLAIVRRRLVQCLDLSHGEATLFCKAIIIASVLKGAKVPILVLVGKKLRQSLEQTDYEATLFCTAISAAMRSEAGG